MIAHNAVGLAYVRVRREGSLVPKGEGKWMVRVFLKRDQLGKRRYISKTVRGSKRDAEEELRVLLTDKADGMLKPSRNRSVGKYLDHWLQRTASQRVRDVTLDWYRTIVDRWIKEYRIAARRLGDLDGDEVSDWLNALKDTGLSRRSLEAALGVLRTACRDARAKGVIRKNPTLGVRLPRGIRRSRKRVTVLKKDQVNRLVEVCRDHPLGAYFILALATGCRPSELAALHWRDVDLDEGSIDINKALSRRKGKVTFADPKTSNSYRGRTARKLTHPTVRK